MASVLLGASQIAKKKQEAKAPEIEWVDDDQPTIEWQSGPDPDNIDDEEITPTEARLRVGALNKPDDRLATLRKFYPDAIPDPTSEGNFIFTDPKTGKTHRYNQEGWIPSWNDLASIVPEGMETAGAITGGVIGGAGGATVGSSVPVVGTTAGAVTGAIAGAGVGGATAKDLTERGINWWFGDLDTRDTSEYLKDKALDVGINAAGEGAGRLLAAGAKPVIKAGRKWLLGGVPDQIAAQKALVEAEELGMKPTLGTITQSPETLVKEATLLASKPNGKLARTVGELDAAIAAKPKHIASELAPTIKSKHEIGTGLLDAARTAEKNQVTKLKGMYEEFDTIAGTKPMQATKLGDIVKSLEAEKKAMGHAEKLSKGPTIDNAIKYAKAIAADAKKGISINKGREFRTDINPLAYGAKEDPYSKELFQRIYKASTDDIMASSKNVSDEALGKITSADAAFSAYKTDGTKRILESTLKKGSEPTKVFQFYSRQIQQAPQALKTVKETLVKEGGQQAWDDFAAYHIAQLGMKNTEAKGVHFTAGKFAKQIADMPREAKEILFTGANKSYSEDLDKLARLAAARASAKTAKAEKPSVIGQIIDWTATGSTFGMKKGAEAMWKRHQQTLLTNPRIVRELVGLPKKQMGFKGNLVDETRDTLYRLATRPEQVQALDYMFEQLKEEHE